MRLHGDLRTIGALAAGALMVCGATASAQRYEPVDLGTLGGNRSIANGINAGGHVVGQARIADQNQHPFWYDGALMHDLGTLGGATGNAAAVNASDAVVGSSGIGNGASHAFLWQKSALVDLGTFGGATSVANGINLGGSIAGRAELATTERHACIWTEGKMLDLGLLPGGTYSNASDVNDGGVVAGFANAWDKRWGFYPNHAFRWQAGTGMRDLGTLGGPGSYAYAINSKGWIVGESELSSGTSHAFLFDGSRMRDLGTLDKGLTLYSCAYDVNDSGRVVGYSDMRDGSSHAFLYDGRRLIDLNTVLTTRAGWLVTYAYGISNDGLIAARGTTPGSGGGERAILLRPAP